MIDCDMDLAASYLEAVFLLFENGLWDSRNLVWISLSYAIIFNGCFNFVEIALAYH